MSQSVTKVILADDLAVFRAGLAEILNAEPDLALAAEASDFSHLESAIEAHPEAIVVSAAHLQPVIGTLVTRVRAAHSRCILLTQPGESDYSYLVQGVDAVVSRDSTALTFLAVIRGVGLRDQMLSAPSGRSAPKPPDSGQKKPPLHHAEPSSELLSAADSAFRDRLTPKEIRILSLVVEGCGCKQIAARLATPEQAVKNYLRALLNSTATADLSELADFTIAHHILDTAGWPLSLSS